MKRFPVSIVLLALLLTGCAGTSQQDVVPVAVVEEPVSKVFFMEDFSAVDEGLLPEGWIDGSHLCVKQDRSSMGGRCLTNFEPGGTRITIPDIAFPDDWKWTADLRLDRRGGGSVQEWRFGDLVLKMRNTGVTLQNTTVKRPFEMGKRFRLAIEKTGPVVKLFIDSQQLTVIRVDGMMRPGGVTISDTAGYAIYRMTAEALD